MIQQDFAYRVAELVKKDDTVIGLAAGGSWISNEIDEYSDLDLILITEIKIAGNKEKINSNMVKKANNILRMLFNTAPVWDSYYYLWPTTCC